jgi:hypothetical protein
MAKPSKEEEKQTEQHWKLVRFQQGLDIYDEDDDGGEGGSGDFGSAGVEAPLTQEDQALLQRHLTRQENHAKEAKSIIIERTWQLSQGKNNLGNSDHQQSFGNEGKMAHPLLADKAQFSGAEELSPFADTDNNQERQLELRQTPEPAPAPAPSIFQTPKNTR